MPSYLLFPAGDVVEAAYDVLFLLLVSLHAASLARVRKESELLNSSVFAPFSDPEVQSTHTLYACAKKEHCIAPGTPRLIVAPTSVQHPPQRAAWRLVHPRSTRPIMHRILTLLACTTALRPTSIRTRDAALTQTRVRTRVINDGEILRRSAEVGPLVRAFRSGKGHEAAACLP